MDSGNRELAVQAVGLLNGFIGDCVISVRILHEYHRPLAGKAERETLMPVHRMCLSSLVLTLYKWLEFYDKYYIIIPDNLHNECRDLTRELTRRKIYEFRHTCLGTIWDNKNNRPLYNSELIKRLNNIAGGDLFNFLDWINNPQLNRFPETVVSIIETLRNELATGYSIAPQEVSFQGRCSDTDPRMDFS